MLSGVRDESSPTTAAASPAPAVQVYTLGGFRVVVDGQVLEDHAWRRRTARQLFKVLLSRPGRRMTRDEVVELFWPDSDADAASSNLRSTVYAMRHALERPSQDSIKELVSSDRGSVWLRPDDELWADADAFEQTVAEAWRSSNPLPRLEQASAMYLGDYLPDDLYEDWAVDRREALKRSWTELQFGLAQALEAHADVNAAMQPLERLLRADPCDERAAQELMKLLARHGRRAEALRVYQRLSQSLREELDVEPSLDSAELQRQIAAGEAPASPPIPAAAFRCSYPFPAPTELIGREAELTALSQVLAGGRTAGRVALVAAPAGTGKSALLGQIVRQAQAQGVMCLAGGCYEERGSVPLGPFHDALVDFLLAQSPERIRAEFSVTIDDLAQLIPELRYHLGLTPVAAANPSSLDRMRAFAAIHACLRSLAERGPVLVCLEDLHAADEATLQLLHYLARQTRRLPLVFVATFRSDEATPEQPLAQTVAAMARERLAQRVNLSALGREQTDQLVVTLLEGSPSEALGESVYATTGGNPLFVEQLVLALMEAGQIRQKAGVWQGDAQLQGTPQIVREVIAQRLQRLEPRCREMLAIASVLGQSFEHKVLFAAVAPIEEDALLRDIDRAIGAQVLQDTPGGYAFRHVLVREAVYWDLNGARRMLLHARAGHLLEHFYGERADDYAAELAYHFANAGDTAAIRAKTLHYSVQAGRRANLLSSNRQALAHFRRALELVESRDDLGEPRAQVEALEGLGYAERGLGLLPEAVASFRRVLGLADEPFTRARVRGEIASALLHNDPTEALAEVQAGLAELGPGTRDPGVAAIRLRIQSFEAMYWFLAGRYEKVRLLGEQMVSLAMSLGDSRAMSRAKAVVSWAHIGAGRVLEAIQQSEQLLAAAESTGDKSEIAHAEIDLGLEKHLRGSFGEARQHLERAIVLYSESANDVWMSNTLQLLGRVSLAEGDLKNARARAESALSFAAGHQERWAAECHDVLGNVQCLAAEYDAALVSFGAALTIRRKIGHATGVVDSLVGMARVYEFGGDSDRAERLYVQAVDACRDIDPCPSVVGAWRHLGHIHCDMGDARGNSELERAFQLSHVVSDTIEFAPTLLEVARARAKTGDLRAALGLVTEAQRHDATVEFSILAHATGAELLDAMGQPESAAQQSAAALSLADVFGAPRLLGVANLAAARVSKSRGDGVRAVRHYQLALRHSRLANAPERLIAEGELAALLEAHPHLRG